MIGQTKPGETNLPELFHENFDQQFGILPTPEDETRHRVEG
jgi:hypothetical protein